MFLISSVQGSIAVSLSVGRDGQAACRRERCARWSVSRVLCPALADGRRPFLWDVRCRTPRATDPGGGSETCLCAIGEPIAHVPPLFGLAPSGVCQPTSLPRSRCALTAPFQPCLPPMWRHRRSILCCTFPGFAPAGRYPALSLPWSPDFPRAVLRLPAAVQPSGAGRCRDRPDVRSSVATRESQFDFVSAA